MSTLEERALADNDDGDRFAGTHRDTLTSFIKTTGELVAMTAERDEALAALTHFRMEIRLLTIGPAHQHHAGKITPSQLCDLLERTEPTDLPKGTKP